MYTVITIQFILSICLSGIISYFISNSFSNYYYMFLMIPLFVVSMILILLLYIFYCYIVCLFIKNKDHKYNKYIDHLIKNLDILLMKFIRVKVIKQNFEIVKDKNVLYVANHVSNMDPLAFINIINKPFVVVSKPENFKIPVIGSMINACGYISINRESAREGAKAIFKARDFLKNNTCSVLIFPEGTRNKTEDIILPMKPGSLKPAFSANKKIVVCSIKGTKNFKFSLFGKKIYIKALDVINPADFESDVKAKDKIEELIKEDLSR